MDYFLCPFRFQTKNRKMGKKKKEKRKKKKEKN